MCITKVDVKSGRAECQAYNLALFYGAAEDKEMTDSSYSFQALSSSEAALNFIKLL